MMAPDIAREARQAITLIKSFSLELDQYSPESQVLYWLNSYRALWIRDAIIEAVYQGRYKIISVQHILSIWQRRGQPVCHFTSGFEQVIAKQLGSPLHLSIAPQPGIQSHTPPVAPDRIEPDRIELDRYVFAPSPMSSSVISTSPPVAPSVVEPSVLSRADYPGLSIKAFPVAAADTLVEVYQSRTGHSNPADTAATPTVEESSANEAQLVPYSDYVRPGESAPIQPFRPMPHHRTYA